jgi:hypothetical protein
METKHTNHNASLRKPVQMTRRYFHVDRRCLAPGQTILPEGTYQNSFRDAAKKMEEMIEAERANYPAKPNRADSLFAFDDEKCAESYWRTHDKSYLYEVEIDQASIGHCGDMHWTDAMGAIFRRIGEPDLEKARQFAKSYWEGEETEKPCREYLLPQAKTIKKLRGLSDKKAWVRSQVTTGKSAGADCVEDLLKTRGNPKDK